MAPLPEICRAHGPSLNELLHYSEGAVLAALASAVLLAPDCLVLSTEAASLRRIASNTSRRWTGTSLGASTPKRTLSPRISTTTIVMSSLMTILSFFLRDKTNMATLLSGCGSLTSFKPSWPNRRDLFNYSTYNAIVNTLNYLKNVLN